MTSRFRVFFLEIWPSVAARERGIRATVGRCARHYVRLVERAITSGRYRADLDPHLAMTVLMGATCQLTAVWLLYDRPFDLAARAAALFATIEPVFLAGRSRETQLMRRHGR